VFGRRPILFAAVAGAAALVLYAVTLAPGLIAIEDTPKFQFVGKILGTAHPPGYPFYVVGAAPDRFIVRAARVGGRPAASSATTERVPCLLCGPWRFAAFFSSSPFSQTGP